MKAFLHTFYRTLLSLWLLLAASDGRLAEPDVTAHMGDFPYRLDRPDGVFTMPRVLDEISGLAMMDSVTVAAVQDEIGTVFLLDIRTGDVVRTMRFGGQGDYEGIERVGDRLFVLESNGDLFVAPADYRSWPDRLRARHVRTRLSARFDTEGLALDSSSGTLLIACKEYPGEGFGKLRAVYRFDPVLEEVEKEPAYLFSTDDAAGVLQLPNMSYKNFKPSALAIHPDSGHLFLVSSADRFIVEFDQDGTPVSGGRIGDARMPQPEGIAFTPGGALLVASEAAGGRAAVFTYLPRSDEN